MALALLARPTANDCHLNRRESHGLLSIHEEQSLASRSRLGDQQAIERLVMANVGLVGGIAQYYMGYGLCYEDLQQEGIRGLLRACADFDPEAHGARFSTYATYWIRNAIQRAIAAGGSVIRLPDYMIRLRAKYRRTLGDLHGEEHASTGKSCLKISHGIDDEIASRMGISVDQLDLVRQSERNQTQFQQETNDDDSISFEEMIADNRQPHLDLDTLEEMACLREGIGLLSPIEAWIIRLRFGIEEIEADLDGATVTQDDSGPKTISWICRSYDIAPKTARRFERSALIKLRAHMRKRVGDDVE